jgi:acyl-CoA thioesterase
MSFFSETSAVFRRDGDIFDVNIDGKWWVVRGPHGGYLTALILRAMTEMVDDPGRSVRSFGTHFVAPPVEGPAEIVPTIERSGRSITFLTARLMQGARTMATSVAAFAIPWRSEIEFDRAARPEVPSPDDGIRLPSDNPLMPTFVRNFDMRWAIGPLPYSGDPETTVGGWLRFAEPEPIDAPAAACLLDAWAPAILPQAQRPVVAPTVDITMHFRRPLPRPDASPDDFFLFRMTSRLAQEGYFEEDGELWAPDGSLVAQSRQLAIALPIG